MVSSKKQKAKSPRQESLPGAYVPREMRTDPIGFGCCATRNRELAGWRYIACMCVGFDKIRMYCSKFRAAQNTS
jgi:hypothetical protein